MAAPGREGKVAVVLTGGIRLGRARRQWSRSHPFPVSSTGSECRRTKSESQDKTSLLPLFFLPPISYPSLVLCLVPAWPRKKPFRKTASEISDDIIKHLKEYEAILRPQ
jgi:hypothetical protein